MTVRVRRSTGLAVAALLLAGCGATAPAPSPEPSSATAGVFPVTVTHTLGSTVIEREPVRVAALGSTDADVVLALGVVPVAIGTYYDYERGVGPWAEDRLAGETPPVLSLREIDFETLAAAAPDLIVNVNGDADRAVYDQLSRIAPTVSLTEGAPAFASAWRDTTRLIAQAMGRVDEGERLVRETEDHLAGVTAANPGFAGTTLTYLDLFGADVYVGGRDAATVSTMAELGFGPVPYVQELPVSQSQNQLSLELLPEVDAEVVLVYGIGASEQEARAAIPALDRLTGYVHFLPDLSLSAPSVLSIPYGIDALVPVLQEATAS